LVWAAAGLWLAYSLWAGKRHAFVGGLALAGLTLAWYWFDRLAMQPSPAPNFGFSIVVSGLLVTIFTFGIVWVRDFLDR